MESSEPSSLSHVSLSTAQTTPRKPSLSTSFPFSSNNTSVPIRAPLTLDDDIEETESGTESNDDELDSITSVVSLSVSEFESNEDDPDEDGYGFVDKYETCNVRPFVGFCDETSVGSEEIGGSSLKKHFIRPIAQLSWDEDGGLDNDCDNFGDLNEVEIAEDCVDRTETFVPSIIVVENISVAPRVKGFENDFWDDREEYDENVLLVEGSGGLGVLEDCELSNLEVDLCVDQNCVENVKIEEYDGGVLEACNCEKPLASTEEDFAEKSSKRDAGFAKFCIENVKVEEYDVGVLRDCEESLVASEAGDTKKSTKVDAGFGKFCVEKLKIEEYGVVVETNMGRSKSAKGFYCLELLDENSDVVHGYVEDEPSLVKTKEANFPVSSIDGVECAVEESAVCQNSNSISFDTGGGGMFDEDIDSIVGSLEFDDFEASRKELDLSGFSMSDQANGAGCDEAVEDSICGSSELTEEIVSETELSVAASSRLRTEDSEDDLQQFDGLGKEEQYKIKKIRLLRLKFLRLVHRIGISLEDSKVAQVLDKLALGFEKQTSLFGTIESAKMKALECEAENESDLDFSLNILVLGKSGVGKSATINLIFGEKKAAVSAFEPATTALKEIIGTINGVKIRILDTPGLRVHATEQSSNRKLLGTISKRLRKFRPDVVLYVDRLDTETIETDSPMLKSITASLGSWIWKNAIVTLTHSSSAPLDGPLGLPFSHKIFAAKKKLHSVLDSIGKVNLMDRNLMCPVSVVENHPLISEDSSGRADLLLLCYSMKVLSEANIASIPETVSSWTEVLGFATRSLLASLLHLKPRDNAEPYNLESEDDGDKSDQLSEPKTSLPISFDRDKRDLYTCLETNKMRVGLVVASQAENVATGFKIEDQITLGKLSSSAISARSMQCGVHAACGANFEMRDKDENPLMGVSTLKWRGDLAFLFLQTRYAIGRSGTNMVAGLELTTERHPRIFMGAVGSDQLHVALVWILQMVIPVFLSHHGAQNQI